MKFLVNGSIAFDLLLSHDGSFLTGIDPKNLEKLSVNYLAPGFVKHHGGTAANISWNLALLGHEPVVIGAVGIDGHAYLALLRERGVLTNMIERREDAITATAIIATDDAERQISFFHPGADGLASLPDFSDEEDIAYAIMSPRNPLLMLKGAQLCQKNKIPYFFDPGQVVHAFSDEELQRAVKGSAGLIVNEYEWQLASTKLGWKERDVVEHCGMLVVTLGEKGIRIATKTESVDIPACKAEKVVNPTGAGDAARAGLLTGLAKKWSLQDAGRLASIMGCLLVEQEGTLLNSLDADTIQGRSVQNFGTKLPL
jgi:adenosine kinase